MTSSNHVSLYCCLFFISNLKNWQISVPNTICNSVFKYQNNYSVWSYGCLLSYLTQDTITFFFILVKEAHPKVEIFIFGKRMPLLLTCRWHRHEGRRMQKVSYPSVEIKNQPSCRTKYMNRKGMFQTPIFFPFCLPVSPYLNFFSLLFILVLFFS